MSPSEELVLHSFLLQKAALRDIVTLAEFSAFFPPSKRSSPAIRDLYRDLQAHRNHVCETVAKQINLETRLGEALVARKWAEKQNIYNGGPETANTETALNLLEGYDSSYVSGIETILKRLEKALSDTQRRMESIQLFIDESTQQISGTSGSLSDLKYGMIENHVLKGLMDLTSVCDRLMS